MKNRVVTQAQKTNVGLPKGRGNTGAWVYNRYALLYIKQMMRSYCIAQGTMVDIFYNGEESEDTAHRSLCYTVGPYCLLYINTHMYKICLYDLNHFAVPLKLIHTVSQLKKKKKKHSSESCIPSIWKLCVLHLEPARY